jgi:transposase
VTWAGEAVAAIRKIVLIEDRVAALTDQVKRLADAYTDLDRRLVRLEAKFELIERLGSASRVARTKSLPVLPGKKKK